MLEFIPRKEPFITHHCCGHSVGIESEFTTRGKES